MLPQTKTVHDDKWKSTYLVFPCMLPVVEQPVEQEYPNHVMHFFDIIFPSIITVRENDCFPTC